VVVRWRTGKAETLSDEDELRVLALDRGDRRGGAGRLLAATSNGPGCRTIWIDYANVAWAAGASVEYLGSATFLERRRAAIPAGRVTAHEIVHALVPELPHAAGGLMGQRLRDSLDQPLALDAR